MDEVFRRAADILCEYIKEKGDDLHSALKFASDALSLYVINAENENIAGFSENMLRETIKDLLSASTEEDSDVEVMAQIPVSPIEYESPIQRKRRGSVSASGNPFAQLTEYPKPENVSKMLLDILEGTRLIARTMDRQQMKKLVSTMFMQTVKKGERLISQGEYGKTMYLIESGEFQILQNGRLKATLRKNSLFGEISLLYSCPRTASVVCTIDAQVWVVTSDAYTAILMVDQRRERELVCQVLEKNRGYMQLRPEEKNKVLQSTHLMHFSKGAPVDVSEPGVFLVLCIESPKEDASPEDKKEIMQVGDIVCKGRLCSEETTVLFIPDNIYSMINEDKKRSFSKIK